MRMARCNSPRPETRNSPRPLHLLDAQGDVALQFAHQPFAQLAAGDVLALAPGEGAVVDAEDHAHRRLFDLDRRQGDGVERVGQGVADAHAGDAGHGHDRPGTDLGLLLPLQVAEGIELGDAPLGGVAVVVDVGHGLPGLQSPGVQAADGDLAHVAAVLQRGDEQLRRAVGIDERRGDGVEDGIEQQRQVRPQLRRRRAGAAVGGLGVDDRELHLLLRRAQVDEQVEGGVDGVVGPGGGAVDLVDDQDDLQPLGQRLAQHKARLGHRPLNGIDQQQRAVDHVHDALHLAAEVGMAGRIDDVDRHALVVDAGVLGQDGDAALALQVVGVKDALAHRLVLAVGVGLLQHAVDQGRFAVVDVGDDGDIADVFALNHGRSQSAKRLTQRTPRDTKTAKSSSPGVFGVLLRPLSEVFSS
jgi:hypothetical protein